MGGVTRTALPDGDESGGNSVRGSGAPRTRPSQDGTTDSTLVPRTPVRTKSPSALTADSHASNRRLAEAIVRTTDHSALDPLIRDFLRRGPASAAAELDDLVAQTRRLDPRSGDSIAGLIDRAKRKVLPGVGRKDQRGATVGDNGIARRLGFRPAAGSGKRLILEPQPGAGRSPNRPRLLADEGARSDAYATAPADRAKEAASEEPAFYQSEEVLDRIERTYRGYVALARKRGWIETADNLERFLSGRGGVKQIDRARARGMEPIREAEETNKKRFERSFLSDAKNGHGKRLKALGEGESLSFSDHWDRDFTFPGHVVDGAIDMALSTGRSKFKSKGDFKAARIGDIIYIEGTVSHAWNDTYDFHTMREFSDGAIALQKHRGAKPFDIKAGWNQKIRGTIHIKDGQLTNPEFHWADEPQ